MGGRQYYRPPPYRTAPTILRFDYMAQQRNWVFTLNNPTETEKPEDLIEKVFTPEQKVRYVVFQKEKGDEGTEHYQGYVEFSTPKRLAAVKKLLPRAHWEARRGTADEARDYCMKDDSRVNGPWESGTFTKTPGKRTDLEDLYKLARSTATLAEVADACPGPYMRHYKAVQHVRQLAALDKPTRTEDLKVYVLYGAPGLGKTRTVYNKFPDVYSVPLGKDLWFDNYKGERIVLLDDFSGNLRLVDCLRLLDRYPIQVPVKGGFVWWCPAKIFITCNVHPRNWYDYTTRQDSYKALTRRIYKVWHLEEDQQPKCYVGEQLSEFF